MNKCASNTKECRPRAESRIFCLVIGKEELILGAFEMGYYETYDITLATRNCYLVSAS